MSTDFTDRVNAIDWSIYHHPCTGSQEKVPGLLIKLYSQSGPEAREAARNLWLECAYQGNACESAVPITPFIMELLEKCSPSIQGDLLDILYQFSVHFYKDDWGTNLLNIFEQYEERLIELYPNTNEDIQSCAEMILSQMMLMTAYLWQPEGLNNQDLALQVSGAPSKRCFTHPFTDHAANISSWIAESPGLSSREPITDASGWRVYNYPARHESQWVEVRISPNNEEAVIKTYWN